MQFKANQFMAVIISSGDRALDGQGHALDKVCPDRGYY